MDTYIVKTTWTNPKNNQRFTREFVSDGGSQYEAEEKVVSLLGDSVFEYADFHISSIQVPPLPYEIF